MNTAISYHTHSRLSNCIFHPCGQHFLNDFFNNLARFGDDNLTRRMRAEPHTLRPSDTTDTAAHFANRTAARSSDGRIGPSAISSRTLFAVFSLPRTSPIPTLTGMASCGSTFERTSLTFCQSGFPHVGIVPKSDSTLSISSDPLLSRMARKRIFATTSFVTTQVHDSHCLFWKAAR